MLNQGGEESYLDHRFIKSKQSCNRHEIKYAVEIDVKLAFANNSILLWCLESIDP